MGESGKIDSRLKKVRVGVVGVGYLGEHHARLYADLPGAELVGVCDLDSDRAAGVAKKYGTRAFASPAELAREVAALSVVVTTRDHVSVAVPLLGGGIDLLVEKPLAATVAEAREIVEAADRGGRILQVGHLERFNGAVRALAPLVRQPRFIEAHRLGPFVERAADVSVVTDLMVHDLDILLAIVPGEIRSILAVGTRVVSDHIDIANARIEFDSGCVANVTASRVSPEKQRRIRIFEPDAYMALDYARQEIEVYRKQAPLAPGGRAQIVRETVHVEKGESLREELIAFLDAVRERKTPIVSGRDGLRALVLAEEIEMRIGQS